MLGYLSLFNINLSKSRAEIEKEQEPKILENNVLGQKDEVTRDELPKAETKLLSKKLDKTDIFLISLASFLILIIIGIRLLPDPTKRSK